MPDWTRPYRRVEVSSSSGYGIYVPAYNQELIREVVTEIARVLQATADRDGSASLAQSVAEVTVAYRRRGQKIPLDSTLTEKMRQHPVYVQLRNTKRIRFAPAKKVRGGKR